MARSVVRWCVALVLPPVWANLAQDVQRVPASSVGKARVRLPRPAVDPSNNTEHYASPAGGCLGDEDEISMKLDNGTSASACAPRIALDAKGSPHCSARGVSPNPQNGCPGDVPKVNGKPISAWPVCLALTLPGRNDYHCFLACDNSSALCPPEAVCAFNAYLYDIGLCTYPNGTASFMIYT
mmetsp:Transcript_29303/g.51287  ORF Transcript_29303/g.51287 Transcript_29303/m.51287 type:complete len:182 (+) Transcript_29303:69-614(+)